MRTEAVWTVAKREYLTRVKSKGFWIATLLLPIAMAALTILPSLIAMKAKASHRLAVVDEVGELGEKVAAGLDRAAEGAQEKAAGGDHELDGVPEMAEVQVELVALEPDREALRAKLDRRVLGGEIDAWLWISSAGLAKDVIEYHAESVSNFMTQSRLSHVLSRVVADSRLAQAGLDSARVAELTRDVDLQTVRVSEAGSREEAGMAGFFLAYFLFFLLYMVVMLYGQQVLNGVLEEKSSRIVEVLLASVRPLELLVGKLLGIGAAGMTQLGIWLATMVALSAPAVMTALAIAPAGAQLPRVGAPLVVHFLVLFLLGFGIFATLYAAVGAATNNIQEAQQYAGFIVIFLIVPMFLIIPIINDPDSTLAVVMSMIPFFTPLLMMLRIAVKMPPLWQILGSYVLTATTVVLLIWICARIYRIGILMYGKKPTFRELWRWIRYA